METEVFQSEDFMGFPVVNHDGLIYIVCDTYSDARACQQLWNESSRKYSAQFPEQKPWFGAGYYIWLRCLYIS